MRDRLPRTFALVLLTAVVSPGIAGCGRSDRGTMSGTLVHKDGSPLAGARVVVRSNETAATAYGTTDDSGYFKVSEGLTPGNYDVNILEDRGDPERRRPATISAKYRDPAKSGLKVTVEAGQTATLNATLDPP